MTEYVMTIKFHEDNEPYLLDISSMLYDLELTHDFAVIIANRNTYANYRFNRYFWYRKGRPVLKEHKIRALRIVKQSPLLLEVVIPSLGAIWILLQIFEKISNWDLNKEKLRLEVNKLRREEEAIEQKRQPQIDIYQNQDWPGSIEIGSHEIERKLVGRLGEINIKPVEINLRKKNEKEG
jgi:hypothetical protein